MSFEELTDEERLQLLTEDYEAICGIVAGMRGDTVPDKVRAMKAGLERLQKFESAVKYLSFEKPSRDDLMWAYDRIQSMRTESAARAAAERAGKQE